MTFICLNYLNEIMSITYGNKYYPNKYRRYL